VEVFDAADHPTVINPWRTARFVRQERLQARELRIGKPEAMGGHGPNIWEL
jgi:hypothetical protein